MLKGFARANKPDKAEIKQRTDEEQAKLAANQIRIKEAKVPVMVIFEGWGSSGKGTVLAKVIKDMDPRFFQVSTLAAKPTEDERRHPFLRFPRRGSSSSTTRTGWRRSHTSASRET